jgi:hypothetical protein
MNKLCQRLVLDQKSKKIFFVRKELFIKLQQEKPSGIPTLLRLVYNQE